MLFGNEPSIANEPNIADWIIAGAEVVAALAAAAAAWLAAKAARASSETAREVRAAHAAAVRPNLKVTMTGYVGPGGVGERRFGLVLQNDGTVDAVDVDVIAETGDGRVSRGHVGELPAHAATPWERMKGIGVEPVPPNVPADKGEWTQDEYLALQRVLTRITVLFADSEHRGRWERVFEPTEYNDPVSRITQVSWVLQAERLM